MIRSIILNLARVQLTFGSLININLKKKTLFKERTPRKFTLSSSELLSSESELSTFFCARAEGFDTAVTAGFASYIDPNM